jgi:hypothetical protein
MYSVVQALHQNSISDRKKELLPLRHQLGNLSGRRRSIFYAGKEKITVLPVL